TDSLILHFSKNGQFISQSSNGLLGSSSMAVTNNGNLMVNGYDTNFVFNTLEINPSGSQVNRQISGDYGAITAHPSSGDYYCSSAGNIIKINSSLMPVATSFTTIVNNISISQFFIKNDSIFFTGVNNLSTTPVYGILNMQLIPLNIIQSYYKKVKPSGITIDNQNRISIIANASSTVGVKPNFFWPQSFSTAFYRFPITGGFVSAHDIGVESFSLISAEKNSQGELFINLRVNIKNYGADSIFNFCLNSESTQNICGYSLFHKFYNATIHPYGRVSVETGPIQSWLLGLASDTGAYFFKREACLYTSVPNQKSDTEISNDASCSRVSKSDTIVERSVPESPYGIYPNPFDQTLTIQLTSEIEEITMHNTLGQLVWQSPVYAKTYILHDFRGAKGVYFLRVKTSEGIQIKKVVKE
ncbi:MAG TPA: T9SS type A sorting domain-containing protein, partial [Bacteroidia bacterium]|nr:T9SS type A sorting domain-containing protein [Bacteroidia bacterium]